MLRNKSTNKLKAFAQQKKPLIKHRMNANDVTHKGFIFKIYKQFLKLNIKKTNSPIKNEEKT